MPRLFALLTRTMLLVLTRRGVHGLKEFRFKRKIERLRRCNVDAVQSNNNLFLQMINPAGGDHTAKALAVLGRGEPGGIARIGIFGADIGYAATTAAPEQAGVELEWQHVPEVVSRYPELRPPRLERQDLRCAPRQTSFVILDRL